MRNDEILGLVQTLSCDQILLTVELTITTCYLGIRVWKVDSLGVETEITSGTAVAIASGTASALISATWNCPETPLDSTDKIRVRVYGDTYSPPDTLLQTFDSEALDATKLDAVTWTVYYYLYRTRVAGLYYYYFRYGASTCNSRIENFCFTPVSLPLFKAGLHPSKPLVVILAE